MLKRNIQNIKFKQKYKKVYKKVINSNKMNSITYKQCIKFKYCTFFGICYIVLNAGQDSPSTR